jgi:cytochrome P450
MHIMFIMNSTEVREHQRGHAGRGCPVIRADYSEPMEACSYLRLADEMREQSPVFFNEFAQGYWVFTRHDAVQDIYKREDLFSSESITAWEPEPHYRFIPTQVDSPDHRKYRRIVNPWFSPQRIDVAEEMVRTVCREHITRVAATGRCDFVADFALQYATEVFLRVIGADTQMTDQFVLWVEDFFRGFGGAPDSEQPMLDALAAIRSYWAGALEERRSDPDPRDGDLASHLLHATFDERPLTDAEILDMLVVLVLAGLDTTRATLGYIFKHLAEHPGDRRRLIDAPELAPSFVEETVRYYPIIFGNSRKVLHDSKFHGVQLHKGDMVYALVGAANRDPRFHERAGEVVIDRRKNNHFGFAGGPHRCLGMHLARRELQVAVQEWLRVIPDFRISTDEVLMERGGGSMACLFSLPLAWDTAP